MNIISFSNYGLNNIKNYANKNYSASPNFQGNSPKKLIEKILSTKQDKKVKLTFDEAEKIYRYLGYDVFFKGGSHAIIPVTDKRNLTLMIPHKDKVISAYDVKKLKFVINGEIDKALMV